MNSTATGIGIIFAVDDVKPAEAPSRTWRAHEAVRDMLDSDIESCSDYHSVVVKEIRYQPLLAAVYKAFSEHRPLILSPDAVWITIAQGVAHHMVLHGEELRSRFVAHSGKLDLVFECQDWVDGSPENPWPDAFSSWSGQIREHVGASVHDTLRCDFSTSGPVERAVSDIVIMDVFERYFHYVLLGVCGIPAITLEGTREDWQNLSNKVEGLAIFDLEWWLVHLRAICAQFVGASRGEIDLDFWQNICKLQSAYGGDIINGWVGKLFPYLRAFTHGPCSRRNPIFETGEGFTTWDAPSGLSRVPFTWRNAATGFELAMEAIGGLIGVTENPDTLALRPKLGWAVREAEKMDVLLSRVTRDHVTFPGTTINPETRGTWPLTSCAPADVCEFYHRTNGANLQDKDGAIFCRILPGIEARPLDWGEKPSKYEDEPSRNWTRFAEMADGSGLAINDDPEFTPAMRTRYQEELQRGKLFHFEPICHTSAKTQGKPGEKPVIALSFTEWLERMLNDRLQPYWLAPGFVSYGDAAVYVRRR